MSDLNHQLKNIMTIKALVEIHTTQNSKIKAEELWEVDYFDDNRGLVWIKKDKEYPAGDTYVSLDCFNRFFEDQVEKDYEEVEEIPQMKGTKEALDKLTLLK